MVLLLVHRNITRQGENLYHKYFSISPFPQQWAPCAKGLFGLRREHPTKDLGTPFEGYLKISAHYRKMGLLLLPIFLIVGVVAEVGLSASPSPTPWPLQFHALLFINSSASNLQATDLWYDWPHGRNFNIIHNQLKNVLHDLEWTNGTSFYYDLDTQTCKTILFDVGILRPDWLVDNSTYLGQQSIDGFTCNVWSKADFIVYYEDVDTNRPVSWVFSSGMSAHVMSFEEGAVLEDSDWQAPAYCFDDQTGRAFGKQRMGVESESELLWRFFTSFDVFVRNFSWSLVEAL